VALNDKGVGIKQQAELDARLSWGLSRRKSDSANGGSMFGHRTSLHWFVTASFLIALFPLFHFARLRLRIDLVEIGGAYWLGTGVRAVFCAVLLYVLCFPWAETGKPAFNRFRYNRWLIVELLAFLSLMIWCFGPWLGAIVVVDGIAIGELLMRRKEQFQSALVDVGIPAIYFFIGIIVVFAFQHGLAGLRFAGACDAMFARFDRAIFHANVSDISHSAMAFLPRWTMHFSPRWVELLFSAHCLAADSMPCVTSPPFSWVITSRS
jgi:hypothetical protein